jgi:hypothetical protein
VGLASAHVPHQNQVLLPGQILSFSQFQHPGFIDRRDSGEIKLVQGSQVRKAGLGDAPFLLVLFPLGHLQFSRLNK